MSSVLNTVKRNVEEEARIVKIDIDQYQAIAAEYGVRSVPTLLILKRRALVPTEWCNGCQQSDG